MAWWLPVLLAGVLGCGAEPEAGAFAPLRIADRGLVSLNDRCPVMNDRLSDAVEPLYVNGRPLGFC